MDPSEAFAITIEPLCLLRTHLGTYLGWTLPEEVHKGSASLFLFRALGGYFSTCNNAIMKQEKNVQARKPQGFCNRIIRMAGSQREMRRNR